MTAGVAPAADPAVIERAADPGEFVIQACQRARTWLREVLEHGDIDQIAELKSQAEAVRAYTIQKQVGKDAQPAAAEIVRRAERGIGLAIRRGQEEGSVIRRGGPRGSKHADSVFDRRRQGALRRRSRGRAGQSEDHREEEAPLMVEAAVTQAAP
jgi:hypothetical protein